MDRGKDAAQVLGVLQIHRQTSLRPIMENLTENIMWLSLLQIVKTDRHFKV